MRYMIVEFDERTYEHNTLNLVENVSEAIQWCGKIVVQDLHVEWKNENVPGDKRVHVYGFDKQGNYRGFWLKPA